MFHYSNHFDHKSTRCVLQAQVQNRQDISVNSIAVSEVLTRLGQVLGC